MPGSFFAYQKHMFVLYYNYRSLAYEIRMNDEKNTINLNKHGIAFEDVLDVFFDPYRIDLYDENGSGVNIYGVWEDRYAVIGYVHDILYVVYTMRENDNVYRIISARTAQGWEI